ncbi:Putative Flp pilus-assembly TadE/G-like [Sulfitobacter dubius]|nr:Putative Flp pilus-assembly TadE/G-like [Sulfitobacter dubius]
MRRSAKTTMFIGRMKHFRKDESGGMLILMLAIFFGITIFGGLAVDLANHERTRTTFQTHLDNAVLAAASLSQELDAEEVVRSYLLSAGLDPSEVEIDTSEEKIGGILVGRTVEASLPAGLNTYFFRFFDIETLGMTISSEATERVEDIEISLVLDVSGSMGERTSDRSGIKLDLLKNAASDFVETILSDSEEGRVSISIIPYSTKVNAGANLLGQYTTTSEHNYSHCVDFEANDYSLISLDPTRQLQRTGHFQFQSMSTSDQSRGQWVCRYDAGFAITPLSNSVAALKAQISALTAEGSTSIDVGAKWGLALLDPSAQAPVSGLIASGVVGAEFQGRPHPHGAENSMKVLVLMTDGENFPEYRLEPEYASGQSDVIRTTYNNSSRFYAVDAPEGSNANDGRSPNSERYFYAVHPFSSSRMWDDNTMRDHPDLRSYRNYLEEEYLDWPEVWAEMSPYYYGYNLYGKRSNYSNYWNYYMQQFWGNMHDTISAGEKDRRLRQICGAANDAGIVIYSIGMDVDSTNSLNLLKDCASSETHYFNVEGLEIQTAFDMIAASISMLRLTK